VTQRDRVRDGNSHTETVTHADTQRHRDTETQRHRDTETQRENTREQGEVVSPTCGDATSESTV
jgi:hypothetical protein